MLIWSWFEIGPLARRRCYGCDVVVEMTRNWWAERIAGEPSAINTERLRPVVRLVNVLSNSISTLVSGILARRRSARFAWFRHTAATDIIETVARGQIAVHIDESGVGASDIAVTTLTHN